VTANESINYTERPAYHVAKSAILSFGSRKKEKKERKKKEGQNIKF
jgi:hypothetical protein